MKIAILGGGVSGLMVARGLAEAPDVEVHVLERDTRLGGLLRSVNAGGLEFDIGSFAFGHDDELIRAFPRLAHRMVTVATPQQSYTPAGTLDNYPLSLHGFVRDNGLMRSAVSAGDMLWGRIRYRRRDSVPAFASYYMGASLYHWSGLQDYIERLYGIRHDELALQLNEQTLVRIRDYTPMKLLAHKVRQFAGRAPPRTMLVRPRGGFTEVWNIVAEDLAALGVCIRLGTEVQQVRPGGGSFVVRIGGSDFQYDAVVSTIPLPLMLRLAGETSTARFDSVSMLSLFYRGRLRPQAPFVYNFTRRGRWKRLTCFSRFHGRDQSQDWFTVEVTTRDTSVNALEELREEFEAHARDLGMLEGTPELLGSLVTERAYPVFRIGDPELVAAERQRLHRVGILLTGRQGRFEYQSSSVAAARARDVARELLAGMAGSA